MRNIPESWRRPDPDEVPKTLQEEMTAPPERGEEYKAPTARRDLLGEATEADVLDQAAVVWEADDDEGRDVG